MYTLAGKTSAVLGPLVFGMVSVQFGSQRPAILSVVLFFAVGMCVVWFVDAGGPNIAKKSQT